MPRRAGAHTESSATAGGAAPATVLPPREAPSATADPLPGCTKRRLSRSRPPRAPDAPARPRAAARIEEIPRRAQISVRIGIARPGLGSTSATLLLLRAPCATRSSLTLIAIADRLDRSDMLAGSGASASLLQGMEEVVARVVPLSGELPAPITRPRLTSCSVATRVRPRDLGDLRAAVRQAHAPLLACATGGEGASAVMRHRLAASASSTESCSAPATCSCRATAGSSRSRIRPCCEARESYPWAHLRGLTAADLRRYAERQRRSMNRPSRAAVRHALRSLTASSPTTGFRAERVHTVGLGPNHRAPEPDARDWSTPRYLFIGVDWERKGGAPCSPRSARVRETLRRRAAEHRRRTPAGQPGRGERARPAVARPGR